MSLTFWETLIITVVGGIFVGLTVWSAKVYREKKVEDRDKKTVYDWLYKRTKEGKDYTAGFGVNDPRWVSTSEIACDTNLTIERVRYICSVHEKIRPFMMKDLLSNQHLEEKWAIRSRADNTNTQVSNILK